MEPRYTLTPDVGHTGRVAANADPISRLVALNTRCKEWRD